VEGEVFVLRDVTRVEVLEEMANRNEKFAFMTAMTSYIAEEIRDPLGSIQLFVDLLLKDLHEERDRERLEQIGMSVKKMDYKIANLLMFTQTKVPCFEEININQMLKDALAFAEYLAVQGNIKINCYLSDQPPHFLGDAEMLKQAFLNLILNAIQAMPNGGDLRIETRISSEENGENAPISFLEIVFQDNGIGIPEESMPKIFDPFFSTKEGRSGLGLTIVHNIVSMHSGTVHIEKAEGGGTVATLLFPCENSLSPFASTL
jgi:signal transduction histidine kinase